MNKRIFRRSFALGSIFIWLAVLSSHSTVAQEVVASGAVSQQGGFRVAADSILIRFGAAFPGDPIHYLLDGVPFTEADVGRTFLFTREDPDAAAFLQMLTDGENDGLFWTTYSHRGGGAGGGVPESELFSVRPRSSQGPDLKGFDLQAIGFRVDYLDLDSPGRDPNGDGIWVDSHWQFTVFVLGDAPCVPALIYDSFGPGNTFATNHPDGLAIPAIGYYTRLAVPFTPSNAFTLDHITVAMSHVSGDNVIRVTVQNDAAGLPGDTVLDAMDLAWFPTISECVVNRQCSLDTAGPGTVKTALSTLRPLLEAGVTYWVVVQPVAPGNIMAWHGATTRSYGRAYDIGQGWATDLETAYALRVGGVLLPDVDGLIALVNVSTLPHPRKRPLLASLNAASASFAGGNSAAGINQLQAFQNKVRAQVGSFDATLADTLIARAQAVIETVCSD